MEFERNLTSIPDEQAESIAKVNDAIQYLEANAK